jgi:hypothetical protein
LPRATSASGPELTVSSYDLSKIGNEAISSPPLAATWKLKSEAEFSTDAASEFTFQFTPDSRLLIAVDRLTESIRRYDVAAGRELLPVLNPPDPLQQQSIFNGPGFVSEWSVTADGRQVVLGQYESLQSIPLDGTTGTSPIIRSFPTL